MTKKQRTLIESETFVRALTEKLNRRVSEKQVKKVAKKVAKAVSVHEAA